MGLKWKTEVGNDEKAKKFQQAYDSLVDARASGRRDDVQKAAIAVEQAIIGLDPKNPTHRSLMETDVKSVEKSRLGESFGKRSASTSELIVANIDVKLGIGSPERVNSARIAVFEGKHESLTREHKVNELAPSIKATLESGMKQMEATDAKITAAQKKIVEDFERKAAAKETQIQQQKAERDAKFFGGQTQKAETAAKKEAEKQRSEQEKAIKAAAKERDALAKAERKDAKGMSAEVDREFGDRKPHNQVKVAIKEGNPLYDRNRGIGQENSVGQDMRDAHSPINRTNQMNAKTDRKDFRNWRDAHDVDYTKANPDGKWSIKATEAETKVMDKQKSFASKFKSAVQAKATKFADKVKAVKSQVTGKHTGGRE